MDEIALLKIRMERYKEILRIIAYPRRGTSDERDYIYAEDCAKLIQSNFSLEELLEDER